MKTGLATILLGLISTATVTAATLSVASGTSRPGGSVILPISFRSDASVISALQFDLIYDSSVISLNTTVGEILRGSGGRLSIADIGPSRKRFVLYGLNQSPIPDGVAANLIVNLAATAPANTYALQLSAIQGATPSGDYAPLNGADGFVSIQDSGVLSRLSPAGVLNAASLLPGAIAPGEIITLIGSGIGSSSAQNALRVQFDGRRAAILYADANQINAVVPYSVTGTSSTRLEIRAAAEETVAMDLPVTEAAPGIFTLDASGIGPGAILNCDSTINTPMNAAERGSIISLFAHGAGQTNPPGIDGQLSADPLPKPLLPVSVQIGGADALILYAGAAPGLIAGVLQINCIVPMTVTPGYTVPVMMKIGTSTSQYGVTLTIK